MKERPILFSGPMVRAILEGKKAQTRRVVRVEQIGGMLAARRGQYAIQLDDATGFVWRPYGGSPLVSAPADEWRQFCPYGQPGDRLWVRETWYDDEMRTPGSAHVMNVDFDDHGRVENVYYRADGECCDQIPKCQCWDVGKPKWRPSIYMPRWASRITLEVTDVRVERLQEISGSDAIAEGIECVNAPWNPVEQFARLWDSINGKKPGRSWASDPWVWVVSFKQVSR